MKRFCNVFFIMVLICFVFLIPVYSENYSYLDVIAVNIRNQVDQCLRERNFSQLEKIIMHLLSKKDEADSLALSLLYSHIVETPEILGVLNEWCRKSPQSHIPFTARGIFYINYAWEARGAGYINTVSEDNSVVFKKRLEQAKSDLELAYANNSDDGNAPASLINVATGLGFDRGYMEEQFNNAVKADPFNYRAYSAKLEYLMPKWHGSQEEAAKFVDEIKNIASEGSRLRLLIATFFSSLYDYKDLYVLLKNDEKIWTEIHDEFQKYLFVHPLDMSARNKFAELAYFAGKYETAAQEFKIIGENIDKDLWSKETFSITRTLSNFFSLIEKGDWKSAENELAANPRVSNLEFIIGRFQFFKDNAGLEAFLNKLRNSGRDAQYHALRGIAFENTGKLKEALDEYSNALRLNPNYSEVYVNAGHVYEKFGDLKQAMNFYQQGIDNDPKNAVAYYDLGRVYEDALQKHTKAISLIEAAIALAPENAEWYYSLGMAYENINDHDKCTKNWEKYLKSEPNGKFANFIRGFLPKVRAGLTE